MRSAGGQKRNAKAAEAEDPERALLSVHQNAVQTGPVFAKVPEDTLLEQVRGRVDVIAWKCLGFARRVIEQFDSETRPCLDHVRFDAIGIFGQKVERLARHRVRIECRAALVNL